MKRVAPILITILVVILAGASASSDRDLIIRLQGEVLVLQRQNRDLQESLDRHHETMSASMQRLADSCGETTKTLTPLAAQLNQAGSLQLHGVDALERRLTELGAASTSGFKALHDELREIKAAIAKSPTQR